MPEPAPPESEHRTAKPQEWNMGSSSSISNGNIFCFRPLNGRLHFRTTNLSLRPQSWLSASRHPRRRQQARPYPYKNKWAGRSGLPPGSCRTALTYLLDNHVYASFSAHRFDLHRDHVLLSPCFSSPFLRAPHFFFLIGKVYRLL